MPVATIETIAALLRKAESTTPAEAEALTQKAQQLASLAAIDLAQARSYTPKHERPQALTTRVVKVAEAGKKGLANYVQLMLAIVRNNDVRCGISGNHVYLYGFDSDIEFCEALFQSLLVQMVQASNAYLATGEHRAQSVLTINGWKRLDGRTARNSFQSGYVQRIAERLRRAREEAVQSRQEVPAAFDGSYGPEQLFEGFYSPSEPQSTSVALALREKTDEVDAHYCKMMNLYHAEANPTGRKRAASWRGGTSTAVARSALAKGRSAADNARLNAPKGLPGQSKALHA